MRCGCNLLLKQCKVKGIRTHACLVEHFLYDNVHTHTYISYIYMYAWGGVIYIYENPCKHTVVHAKYFFLFCCGDIFLKSLSPLVRMLCCAMFHTSPAVECW